MASTTASQRSSYLLSVYVMKTLQQLTRKRSEKRTVEEIEIVTANETVSASENAIARERRTRRRTRRENGKETTKIAIEIAAREQPTTIVARRCLTSDPRMQRRPMPAISESERHLVDLTKAVTVHPMLIDLV
jgi:hypothetical protein